MWGRKYKLNIGLLKACGTWAIGLVSWSLLARLHTGGSIKTYNNVYMNSILIDAAVRGDLTPDNTVLMLLIDSQCPAIREQAI